MQKMKLKNLFKDLNHEKNQSLPGIEPGTTVSISKHAASTSPPLPFQTSRFIHSPMDMLRISFILVAWFQWREDREQRQK